MHDFHVYYIESNLVCVIIFGIMLMHDLFNVDRQEKQIKYDRALIAFMLYFLSDSLWAAFIAGVLPRSKHLFLAVNLSNFVIMGAITYCWLGFVLAAEQAPHRNRRANKLAMIFPLLLSMLVMIVTYLAAPQVLLSDALELQPAYDVLQLAVPDIYIIAILFYSIRKARNTENPVDRRNHLYIGLFPLTVVVGGLIQAAFFPYNPIFCFCSTILMLIFYIQAMETRISIDPLTKLNNRGQLLRYVSQRGNAHIDGKMTFVVMIDINDFKQINDSHGHAEGDRALVIIADSLRQVAGGRSAPVFLGRYGGDEFILIAHLNDRTEIEAMIREIRGRIESRCRAEGLPYVLTVSAGYDELKNAPDSFQKCVQRADKNLYRDKADSKVGRHTAYAG